MAGGQPRTRISLIPAVATILVVLLACGGGPAWAGTWAKVAVGSSGMAMDDINNGDFRFYDNTISGYDFPDLKSGFSLSFHLGYDMSPDFALGFSWDNQYARVEGTDEDTTGDLDLDANFFMAHLYWTPLKTDRWNFGAAAGMGLVFPDGKVKVTGSNNVNYGEGETSGNSAFALELMGLADWAVGKSTHLELTLGWRDATVDEVKLDGAPVLKEDGSNLALDYTGYLLKLGIKYKLGEGTSQ